MRNVTQVSPHLIDQPKSVLSFPGVLEYGMVKSRDHLIRLKRFQVEERRRRVAQIEAMIADFGRMSADLDREIATEEQRSGISDQAHFAYPTYARAAIGRRDNLRRSAGELRDQLEEAKEHLAAAAEEMAKAENLEGRDKAMPQADHARADMLAAPRFARA